MTATLMIAGGLLLMMAPMVIKRSADSEIAAASAVLRSAYPVPASDAHAHELHGILDGEAR